MAAPFARTSPMGLGIVMSFGVLLVVALVSEEVRGRLLPIAGVIALLFVIARAVHAFRIRAAAAEAFRQRHYLLASVFDCIRDGVIATDRDGRFLIFNPEAQRILGTPDIDVPPARWTEFFGVFLPDMITPFPVEDLPLARAMRGESTDDVSMLIRHQRLANDVWVSVSGRPLRNCDGLLCGGVAIIVDMTSRLETEFALRQSEERFRSLVDSIKSDAAFLLDEAGRIVSWNAGAARISGYAPADIIGQHVSSLYTSTDIERGRPREELETAARTGCFEGEGWRVRNNGSIYWAGVRMTSMRDSAGTIQGYTMVSRDVNEGRKSESRYRALLEATPDAIIIVNHDGRIELANAQTEALFGHLRPELIGQSVDMLMPRGLRGSQSGQWQDFFESPRRRLMGQGRELLGLRKDGTEFPVELSVSPLETEDGVLALAAIRDGTERKRAEMRFRALLESAPDAMVIFDAQGRIELANAQVERLFGHTRPELIGQSVDMLVPARFRGAQGDHRQGFFHSPTRQEMGEGHELFGLRKDGLEFPMELSLSPPADRSGGSVTAAIRDVTPRKTAERALVETIAKLERSNNALEQFAYVTSHDLQEPLRMVSSYTQLLAKRYKGRLDAEADEFIAFAVDGSHRMRRLIQDLLAYSRAGISDEPLGEVDSDAALREALSNLEAAVNDSAAVVTQDALPRVRIHHAQLVQVFQNLIGNAIKYRGAEAPRIHIAAHSEGTRAHVFSVHDNGMGIDPQQFERIFVIFQRLHAPNAFTGTGIGLAICKKLVEQNGGRIWLDSIPGKGSTFRFTIRDGVPS